IAADASGNAIAIWEDVDEYGKQVILSTSFNRSTYTWNAPVILSEPWDDSKDAPAIKMGHYGLAICAFRDSSISVIQARTYWNEWSNVHTFIDSGALSEPIVAVNYADSGVIAWISSVTGVHASIFKEGVIKESVVLDDATTSLSTSLSIAINDAG